MNTPLLYLSCVCIISACAARILSMQALASLESHSDSISSIAFSPDSKHLATASFDGTVKVWNVQNSQEPITLSGHSRPINCIAYSPDGKTLAMASSVLGKRQGEVILWDMKRMREQATIKSHSSHINAVAFSPNGKVLATAGNDSLVKLWDLSTRQERMTLTGHLLSIYSVKFSPNGKLLASSSKDGALIIWDANTGQRQTVLQHEASVVSIAFSPDGSVIASGECRPIVLESDRGVIRMWKVADGKEICKLRGHSGAVNCICFAPDGNILASGSWEEDDAKNTDEEGEVIIWDAKSYREISKTNLHRRMISALAFSPDGEIFATGSLDYTVKIQPSRNIVKRPWGK